MKLTLLRSFSNKMGQHNQHSVLPGRKLVPNSVRLWHGKMERMSQVRNWLSSVRLLVWLPLGARLVRTTTMVLEMVVLVPLDVT